MKNLSVVILLLFALGAEAFGQTNDTDVANLREPHVLWTETNPRLQIGLGVGDLFLIASIAAFESPEVREATRKYSEYYSREKELRAEYKEAPWQTRALALEAQTKLTRQAKMELQEVAARQSIFWRATKYIRWFGAGFFAVDLGTRVCYFYMSQEDPGWFPGARIFKRLRNYSTP